MMIFLSNCLSAKRADVFISFILVFALFHSASAQNCSDNLALNSGFENGISGWNVLAGSAVVSSDAYSGNSAIALGGSAGANIINQAFPGTPEAYYSLRAFVKKNNADNTRPVAVIKFYTSTWQPINSPSERISGESYEELFFSRKAPSNTAYVAVEFSYSTNPNNQLFLIDDVCFMEEPNNSNCSINAQIINLSCDNNGTPVNQLDDTFTADLLVTGSNTGSGFRLTKTNFFRDYGSYNEVYITEELDIRDGVQEFVLTDLGNENCEYTISITPPPTCSDSGSGCNIDVALTQPLCNNNGTPDNPLDDTYSFDATVTGTNISAGWTSTSSVFPLPGPISGDYNTPTNVGPFPVYNSTLTYFGVGDNDSNSPCFSSMDINGPLACSSGNPDVCPGSILQNGNFSNSITGWELFGNTGIVPDGAAGDGIEICTNLANGLSSSRISQEFDIPPGSDRKALITWNYKRISGDGLPIVRMTFYDSDNEFIRNVLINPGYQRDWNTFSQERNIPDNASKVTMIFGVQGGQDYGDICAVFDELCFSFIGGNTPSCDITASAAPSVCLDNGTPFDPDDDRYNITIDAANLGGSPAGYSISYVASGVNKNFNGVYGTTTFIGQNLISAGPVTLTLTDKSDTSCTEVFLLNPPSPCTNQGGNGGDLKLSATGTPSSVGAWQFANSTFEIINEGAETVSRVEVTFDINASAKLKGGDEYSATQGTLEEFWTQAPTWEIGSLEPGQSETIQLNFFTLSDGEIPIYGQVTNASGNEDDSTPNNGTPPVPNEDDEAVFTFNGSSNPTPQPDLELSNLFVLATPSQGALLNFAFDLINSGTATAVGDFSIKSYISSDDILRNDDIQDGIVPTGNLQVGVVTGVPGAAIVPADLPAGDYFLILKVDADDQITESNEGNNVISVPFTILGTLDLPDLTVENVIPRASQVIIGEGVSTYFDGVNLGDPVPFSNFPIFYSLYMSTDQVLDPDDVKVLDLGLGIGNMQQFGGQVPPGLPPGDYYLIVETDFINNIAESNEGNNWTASIQTVSAVVANTASCSFVTNYSPTNFGVLNSNYEMNFSEIGGEYILDYNEPFSRFLNNPLKGNYRLNSDGDVIDASESIQNFEFDVELEVDSDKVLEMVFVNSPDLPSGTRVVIDYDFMDPTAVITDDVAFKTSTGFAFGIGIVTDGGSGLLNRIIQTDNFGQNVRVSELPDPYFYGGFSRLTEGVDGSIYTEWKTSGNYTLYGVPADGSPAWVFRVASDTPSSTWTDTKVSKDGNFVYTSKTDNLQVFISKLDARTGIGTGGLDIASLKEPSPGGTFRYTFSKGIQPTDDGGLLATVSFSEVSGSPRLAGEVLAKFEADGSLGWSLEIPNTQIDMDIRPVGETSDGGALFAGINNNSASSNDEQTIFIKTTSKGKLTPECGGTTLGPDLNLSFAPVANPNPPQWSFFSLTLNLTNEGTETAENIVVRFDKSDEVVYKGGDEFTVSNGEFRLGASKQSWHVSELEPGQTAVLTVNYFRVGGNSFSAFAQVSQMDGTDVDSSPFNGNCCTSNEDDEAVLSIGNSSSGVIGNRNSLTENLGTKESFAIINAAPNPFTDRLDLNIFSNENQSSELMIYNALGKQVLQQAVEISEGHNTISVETTSLPGGVLTVKMTPEHKYLRSIRVIKISD